MKFKIKAEVEEFKQDVFIPEAERQINLLLDRLYKFNLLNNGWIAYYEKQNINDVSDQIEDCKEVKEKLLDLIQTLERIKNQ